MISRTRNNIIICTIFLILMLLIAPTNIAYAYEFQDGQYKIAFESKMGMGIKAFENEEKAAILGKIGDNYYLTLSLKSEKISDFTLHLTEGKVGEIVTFDGGIERHTYTLSETALNGPLNFSMFIKKMGNVQSFTITPIVSSNNRLGDVDKSIERPALFVPSIHTDAVGGEQEVGSKYVIAPAFANMGDDTLDVNVSAYYVKNGNSESVQILNGSINLDKLGEYHIVYRAETSKYKTNLGNNSFSEIDITIISKNNAKQLVKVQNIDGKDVLPSGVNVVSGYVDESRDIYKTVSKSMKKIADIYEVLSVTLYDSENNLCTLNDNIEIYFNISDKFDMSKVTIYYVNEDGSLIRLGGEVDGNYVKINTDKVGTFIACIEGVEFIMPMWGYALIVIAAAIILVIIIVVPIVVTKKKKKQLNK